MAKAARIPRFGVDKGHHGTIVVGRRFEADLTQAEVKSIHKTVEAARTKTGLPLVFVSPGPAETEKDDSAGETFYAGLLVASAQDGSEPVHVNKDLLDSAALDTIPATFWEALEEKHELAFDEDDDDEEDDDEEDDDEEDDDEEDDDDNGPATGVFLVPAGWAVASIYLGSAEGEPLATTSSEDTSVGKRLGEDLIAQIRAAAEPVLLVGAYC